MVNKRKIKIVLIIMKISNGLNHCKKIKKIAQELKIE